MTIAIAPPPAAAVRLRPWTFTLVAARLVEEFRALPEVGMFSPRVNELRPAAGDPGLPIELITLSVRYLGRDHVDRKAVMAWASAVAAGREIGELPAFFSVHPHTFGRMRRRACRRIAEGLNVDGIPYAVRQCRP